MTVNMTDVAEYCFTFYVAIGRDQLDPQPRYLNICAEP